MGLAVEINFDEIKAFNQVAQVAPQELTKATAQAFKKIGRYDIAKFRRTQLQGGAGLRIRSKQARKAFKFKTNKEVPKHITQIFLSEYVGWKAARIFEKGGTITPKKAKTLTILPPWMRNGQGKRKETIKQIRAKIAAGQYKIIRTKSGPIVIRERGGLNKKGDYKKGSRVEVIAFLRRRVTEKKRINWYDNFKANKAVHDKYLERAAELTLIKFAKKQTGVA